MLLFTIAIYSLLHVSSSHVVEIGCAKEFDRESTITPFTDGIATRYHYEWCTSVYREQIESWSLILYVDDRAENQCLEYDVRTKVKAHSRMEKELNKTLDCDKICFSTNLDLIYDGCYTFKNELYFKEKRTEYKYVQHIQNEYTVDSFQNKKTWYSSISNPDHLIVGIHNSHIPIYDFDLKLCSDVGCEEIESNCSKISDGLSCLFPSSGEISVILTHHEPWAYGDLFNSVKIIRFELSKFIQSETHIAYSGWAIWQVGVLSVFLLLVLFVIILLWRIRVNRRKKDKLHHLWKNRFDSSTLISSEPMVSPVLIVHSNESSFAIEAIHHLAKALQINGVQVWDSQSPKVIAAMSPNPIQWLREELKQAKLILIQPYQMPDEKSPHYGDKLVNYVINTIQTSKVDFPYHKYYVARYSEIPCSELVPSVVPFRRYLLPEMVDQLVEAITNRPISSEYQLIFQQAANEHQKHIKHKYNLD